uniref:5-oxoprolinase-like n=1 Tax=Dermatophagoides pteronyssinus TaxID=6956 RepID=A0A6P6XR08_DERPT|nr:5-oxoprolinase-like [Dermatophagoides pteronyssinus]
MFRIAMDRGGTFTDVFAIGPNKQIITLKLMSSNPSHYKDAPFEAIKRILNKENPDDSSLQPNLDMLDSIRMGTTVATNALLEHKGERVAIVLTKGFRDIFQIGYQNRENIFELDLSDPFILYEQVIEVDERIIMFDEQCEITRNSNNDIRFVDAITGDKVGILKQICLDDVRKDLQKCFDSGIRSLAIAFIHSYLYPEHELIVEKLAKQIGFNHITLSHRIMKMIRYVPRGMTSILDAYLTPHIQSYIDSFLSNFNGNFDQKKLLFMQSDGGLTNVSNFSGCRSILSGPAGGVVGYALTTVNDIGNEKPIIGFDMGGTSTDVSRYDGKLEHKFESKIADVIIQYPQLDIHTVAAGGGSRLYFRNGLFVVGPESSGSYPGPICYRNNGYLSVTDANLCLGRLLPDYFPKIFGPNKNQGLDSDAVRKEFKSLSIKINEYCRNNGRKEMTIEEIALGFIMVANETMCRPIRSITQGKGYDIKKHVLTCFGGAGGQHACSIARSLGIEQIFIHKYSGILSAYGIALADIVHEETMPCSLSYERKNLKQINSIIIKLSEKCDNILKQKDFNENHIRFEIFLNLRYDKTDFSLMVTTCSGNDRITLCNDDNFRQKFLEQYEREFGFIIPDRTIIVDDIRIRSIGFIDETYLPGYDEQPSMKNIEKTITTTTTKSIGITKCYFENIGYIDTPIYRFDHLQYGECIQGPAIIIETNSTILIEPLCDANVTKQKNLLINVHSNVSQSLMTTELDPIYLSLFSHIFMGIAEQMGSALKHTAISTNIKERLDFSCAIFSAEGYLVSNAPHIPVHLGSMGKVVEYLYTNIENMNEGDVYLTNHPSEGGTHLPDLTVVTPVFHGKSKPIFFLASRGHHADIGGLTPGSMPSNSTRLIEEGAQFKSFKLVSKNIFQEENLIKHLMMPKNYPGCSGTRALNDNLSDLKAQIAANNKGLKLVNELIDQYGLEVVLAYMNHIQQNAELEVRDLMRKIAKEKCSNILMANDMMDDGSIIELKIMIDPLNGQSIFDFTGTSEQVHGNWNAPESITYSAVIYCLRCMIGHNIPLNQGILSAIKIIFPKNSLISPDIDSAVVGGNVLTSQRITDVIFKAFDICAASQGCMNNITFGDSNVSYYETVAGGAGATANCSGRSGVHTHMTNTRMTDVEIFEKRYPVILKKFSINYHTGGLGLNSGGNGIIREILFRKNLTLSVLTERRVFSPYGIKGGQNGKRGKNLLQKNNGIVINLGAKNTIQVNAGDVFHLETPGGGGYGSMVAVADK